VRSDMEERAMERQTIIYVTARQENGGKTGSKESFVEKRTHSHSKQMSACVPKCLCSCEQHFPHISWWESP